MTTDLITRLRTGASPESPLGRLMSEAADVLAAQGWQTMDSAPLDGTPVDLWAYRGDRMETADRYTDCRFTRRSFGTEPYGDPVWCGLNDRHTTVTPTHWRPLPERPSTLAQEIG